MYSLGSILREARENKKISLEEAHKATKIHSDILNALEQEEFERFDPVYIKGFLRIYAEYLKLDAKSVVDLYLEKAHLKKPQQEEKSISQAPSLPPQIAKLKSHLLKPEFRRVILRILIGVIMGLFLIYIFSGIIRKINSVREKSRLSIGASETTKLDATEETVVSVPSPKGTPITLSIRAKQNCWLKVRLDGKIVFQDQLKKGTAETWRAKEKIELSIGDAGAIDLEINGELLDSLGRRGQPIKNIIITSEGFKIIK